ERHHSPGGARLEVGRGPGVKIAIDGRDHHRVPERRLLAHEPGLDLARRRAAIAIDVVAVVAIFVDDDAVAAAGHARAGLAVGLVLAVGRTTVERKGVAVVAPLGAFDLLVPAGGVRALARVAAALPPHLHLAGRRAAVAGRQVAVVAQLGQDHDAVTAAGDAVARLPGRRARIS